MHSVFASEDKGSSGSKSKNGFVRRVFSRHQCVRKVWNKFDKTLSINF
jgi:hypothetical protein